MYRTKVSLFSSMLSTATFSQYCAVMTAIVGCLLEAIVGICFTTLISLSSWWILVNELNSIDLMRPRVCSEMMILRTSSSDQPLSLFEWNQKVEYHCAKARKTFGMLPCEIVRCDGIWISLLDKFENFFRRQRNNLEFLVLNRHWNQGKM